MELKAKNIAPFIKHCLIVRQWASLGNQDILNM